MHAPLVYGSLNARQILRCPTYPTPASDKALYQPTTMGEISRHLEHFQALHSSMFPMAETLRPLPLLLQ